MGRTFQGYPASVCKVYLPCDPGDTVAGSCIGSVCRYPPCDPGDTVVGFCIGSVYNVSPLRSW